MTGKNRLSALLLAAMAYSFAGGVAAQLYSDFSPASSDDAPSNVYFGTAKDADGNYIRGATVVVATSMMDFVAVTDHRGRFRLNLPVDIAPTEVQARCSHNAYGDSRVVRRLPRGAALSPVEISCRLL
ncbi:MAG: hypothetical protein ABR612_05765 [Chromatocurvus sp.]